MIIIIFMTTIIILHDTRYTWTRTVRWRREPRRNIEECLDWTTWAAYAAADAAVCVDVASGARIPPSHRHATMTPQTCLQLLIKHRNAVSYLFIYLLLFIYYKIVHEAQKYKIMQINEITSDS